MYGFLFIVMMRKVGSDFDNFDEPELWVSSYTKSLPILQSDFHARKITAEG